MGVNSGWKTLVVRTGRSGWFWVVNINPLSHLLRGLASGGLFSSLDQGACLLQEVPALKAHYPLLAFPFILSRSFLQTNGEGFSSKTK